MRVCCPSGQAKIVIQAVGSVFCFKCCQDLKKEDMSKSFKLKNSVRKCQWVVGGKILDGEDYERVGLKELERTHTKIFFFK